MRRPYLGRVGSDGRKPAAREKAGEHDRQPKDQERGGAAAVARRRPGDSFARARGHGGNVDQLARRLLVAGEAALTTRALTGEELESDRLKARLGAALIERDVLNEKIAWLESDRPFVRRRRKS